MDNRNTVIAILLSLAILLGWEYFFAPKAPPPGTVANDAPAASAVPPSTPGSAETVIPMVAPTAATPNAEAAPTVPAKRIRIATPYLLGSLSLTGARFDDITLINYRETIDPSSPAIVLLAPAGSPNPYYAEWGWISSDSGVALPTSTTTWTTGNPDAVLTETTPLVLTWDNGQGLVFTRTIRADKQYLFTVEQTVVNSSEKPVTLYPYSLVVRLDEHGTGGNSFEGLIGAFNNQSKEVKYADLKKRATDTAESVGGWIGFSDKYWLSAVAFDPALKITGTYRYADAAGRERYQTDLRADPITMAPGETKSVMGYMFAGAKELALLDAYSNDPGLQRFDLAIDFGWYYFLTKPFFQILRWLHGLIGNFGIAILALSTLIRLLMFPIANKQFKTMNKMKRLQPEMKRLQEKHASDKTKLNQELMELYKREKANPLAGCLPILLQIPVFYALYKVLSVTIEMRHAPFYGWIHDLSAPDPTSVLNLFGLLPYDIPPFFSLISIGAWPIIMGATMWIQQRLSPQPADPMQARIMMLMPIIITFVLAPYAAGLVIYWAFSNTLGILQQWILLRRTDDAEVKTAP